MKDELGVFAERLQALMPERGRGKRFSAEARAVCVEAVELGSRAGLGIAEVSRRLSVSVDTLRRWTEGPTAPSSDSSTGTLHEVVLRGMAAEPTTGLTVTARDGLAVSGVGLSQLAAVVAVLRT